VTNLFERQTDSFGFICRCFEVQQYIFPEKTIYSWLDINPQTFIGTIYDRRNNPCDAFNQNVWERGACTTSDPLDVLLRSCWCSLVVGVTGGHGRPFQRKWWVVKAVWPATSSPRKTMRWDPYASHNPLTVQNHFGLAAMGVATGSDSIRVARSAISMIPLWLANGEGL